MNITKDHLLIDEFKDTLLNVDWINADNILSRLENIDERSLLIEKTLEKIGEDWDEGKAALAQVYMAGRICEEYVGNNIDPAQNIQLESTIGIATLDDYHPLGKKIVRSFLRSNGIKVLDFGHGIGIGELTEKVIAEQLDILLISVLMLPAALKIKELRESILLKNAGLCPKIMVGGAPFRYDEDLWKLIEADAVGRVPGDALKYIREVEETG